MAVRIVKEKSGFYFDRIITMQYIRKFLSGTDFHNVEDGVYNYSDPKIPKYQAHKNRHILFLTRYPRATSTHEKIVLSLFSC